VRFVIKTFILYNNISYSLIVIDIGCSIYYVVLGMWEKGTASPSLFKLLLTLGANSPFISI